MDNPDTDDLPAVQPAFNFDLLAGTLVATLQRRRAAAYVLGLHGAWGSGKSTLMGAIQAQLPAMSIVVEFSAWKYQNREALGRALILRMIATLRQVGGDAKKLEQLERSLYESFTVTERGPLQVNWTAAITEVVQTAISLAALGVGVPAVQGLFGGVTRFFGQKSTAEGKAEDTAKRIERVSGILQRKSVEHAIQQVVSIEQFLSVFRDVTKEVGEGRRIYVLIDDLDRCLPEAALDVFETLKLFLDAPECIYVLAVDRAVIRRGLELRYPASHGDAGRLSPPTVDPDEYIEKVVTLSVDIPMLSVSDGHMLLGGVQMPLPLTGAEAESIIHVLGTNPRRLKRFAAMLALWLDVAAALETAGRALGFSPTVAVNRPLFLKLSLLGYLNSAVISQMLRDPALPGRLQKAANAAFADNGAVQWQMSIHQSMSLELPMIAQASLDPALWRAMLQTPLLRDGAELQRALAWFRSVGG